VSKIQERRKKEKEKNGKKKLEKGKRGKKLINL
jgi:hypothetical protein